MTSTADQLNTLLADYQVHYQKLRNYHWNVRGPMFFELHLKFAHALFEFLDHALAALHGAGFRLVQARLQLLDLRLALRPQEDNDRCVLGVV